MSGTRKFFGHLGVIAGGLILLLGLPLWSTGALGRLTGKEADAVSSASLVLEAPSGNFLIFINSRLHRDEEALEAWKAFFSGREEETAVIFEDISCSVAQGDAGAMELAASFQSRLPENQMVIRPEEATLLFSRADAGKYDILIVSSEWAELFRVSPGGDAERIELAQGGES